MKFSPIIIALCAAGSAQAGDWSEWGHDASKNMAVPDAKNLPVEISGGEKIKGTDQIDLKSATGAKWVSKLGSQSYGTKTSGSGKILLGTNNESPRIPAYEGDHGCVYCLDEKTGEFIWQLTIPKLGAGKVSDWEFLGVCSSPSIVGDRAYVITNRCEVLCLDLNGLADGNQGMQDEGKYIVGGLDGLDKVKEPVTLTDKDADIIWGYDMRGELGVFPHNVTSSSILHVDGKLFVTTSNGVDWSHQNLPAPNAPCLISLDAKTGELIGEEGSGIGERIFHCNWSSPAYGGGQVIFGAGDGFCYGFGTTAKEDEEGFKILPELWRVDCIPAEYRKDDKGEPIKYATFDGPSEIIGTPVYYEGRVYVAIGQDPEHGEGVGQLVCIDPKEGKVIWASKEVERTISTCSVADGLVYIADYTGRVHCFDAVGGTKYWEFDTKGHIWGSTLVADGKVYIGNEEGELFILKAGKKMEQIGSAEFTSPIYSTPTVANGVLYVQTQTHLYAFEKK